MRESADRVRQRPACGRRKSLVWTEMARGSTRARTIRLRSSKGADGRGYIIRLLNRELLARGEEREAPGIGWESSKSKRSLRSDSSLELVYRLFADFQSGRCLNFESGFPWQSGKRGVRMKEFNTEDTEATEKKNLISGFPHPVSLPRDESRTEGEARGFPIGHEARRGALTKRRAGVDWRFISTGIGGSHGVEVVGGKQRRRQRQCQR